MAGEVTSKVNDVSDESATISPMSSPRSSISLIPLDEVDEALAGLAVQESNSRQNQIRNQIISTNVVRESASAIQAYNPESVCACLKTARALVVAAKEALPNPSLCPEELKGLVKAVQQECDDFSWTVSDFVVETRHATMKLGLLTQDVLRLVESGHRALERVHNCGDPWNYGSIRNQVEKVKKTHSELVSHLDAKFASVKSKLCQHKAESIQELLLEIHGTRQNEKTLEAGMVKRRQRVFEARKQVTLGETNVEFMTTQLTLLNAEEEALTKQKANLEDLLRQGHEGLNDLKQKTGVAMWKVLQEHTAIESKVRTMVPRVAVMSQQDIEPLEHLRHQVNVLLKKSADAKTAVDIATGVHQDTRSAHILFVVDEGYGMQRDNNTKLQMAKQKIRELRQARQFVGSSDQVSLVVFESVCKHEPLVLNKGWKDVLKYCGQPRAHYDPGFGSAYQGSYSVYREAMTGALEVVQHTQPREGSMQTILFLLTDCQPDILPYTLDLARKCSAAAKVHGSFHAFVISMSESGKQQLKMDQLVAALNDGDTGFVDAIGHRHEFFTSGHDSRQLAKKFDAVTGATVDASMAARAKHQHANERMEELQSLIRARETQVAEKYQRKQILVARELEKIQKDKSVAMEHTKAHTLEIQKHQEELVTGIVASIEQVQAGLDETAELRQEATVSLRLEEQQLRLYKEDSQEIDELFKKEYTDAYKENMVLLNKKFGSFNAELLADILTGAQQLFQNSRCRLLSAMDAFYTVSHPVENAIVSLELTEHCPTIDVKSKPLKVLKEYERRGVAVDWTAPVRTQFFNIVRHTCPQAKEHVINNFVDVMNLTDFCFSRTEPGAEQKVEDLKSKLKEGLSQLSDDLIQDQQELEEIQQQFRAASNEVRELRKTPDAESKDDTAVRTQDLKCMQQEMQVLSKRQTAQEAVVATRLQKEFSGEMRILPVVQNQLEADYEKILLCDGLADCREHLSLLYNHFKIGITDFRRRTEEVSEAYTTRVLSAEESIKICLQDGCPSESVSMLGFGASRQKPT